MPIGAYARSGGSVVVTGNPDEFTPIDGLRCEDWLEREERPAAATPRPCLPPRDTGQT